MAGTKAAKAKPETRGLSDRRPTFTGAARPKYMIPGRNVYDAALDRIRFVFDEFHNQVSVSTSGGKDSTVILELASIVNNERGLPPLDAMFLDQECEFQATVDYMRYLMYDRDDINLRWYQIPFLLENSTNHEDPWLKVWDTTLGPDEWMRPKEPGSIHTNRYGQDKFHELLSSIATHDTHGATVDGMRSEESPARRLLMTSKPMYKWTTWSAVDADPRYGGRVGQSWSHRWRFHPIYDWSYRDVWKAIDNNGWRYNAHYDHLFQHGVNVKNMRVSNFHHETALTSLHWLQEIEPATWEKATQRLAGISTYGHLKSDQYPTSLPYMFKDWDEYLNYLINNLVPTTAHQDTFRKQYQRLQQACPHIDREELATIMVKTVIGNDLYGTATGNFMVSNRPPKKTETP
jgi:predicted phosphoadenosine phosphosulfate sulfurtransferase